MGKTVELLHDTHVLVLMDDLLLRDTLSQLFGSMGASVYTAQTQNAAIGMYWRLFRDGIRPRAVVTGWHLVKPETQDYEFLKMIGREEIDGTVLDLFNNITDLDSSAFLAVYTEAPDVAASILTRHGIGASVFDRDRICPEKFVARIATHDGISSQRVSEESVERDLKNISSRVETERITRSTKRPSGFFAPQVPPERHQEMG